MLERTAMPDCSLTGGWAGTDAGQPGSIDCGGNMDGLTGKTGRGTKAELPASMPGAQSAPGRRGGMEGCGIKYGFMGMLSPG
jgi:hypothetical protein